VPTNLSTRFLPYGTNVADIDPCETRRTLGVVFSRAVAVHPTRRNRQQQLPRRAHPRQRQDLRGLLTGRQLLPQGLQTSQYYV